MLRWLGDQPGRVAGWFVRQASLPADATLPDDTLAELVARSPRANGYLSLEPGLHRYTGRDGAVTWAAGRRTAFAVGGLHVNGDLGTLASDFRESLRGHGFRRALVFPVAEDERAGLVAARFESLMVGVEAFVDAADFTLAGKRFADLRQMTNRAANRHKVTVGERTASAMQQAREVYPQWLAERQVGHRMRLLIGTPSFDRPFARRYFVASVGDEPVAFVTLTPGWGGDAWGVDVMARAPSAPAGAMELLLTRAMQTLFSEGIARVSLGACPMADAGIQPTGRDRRVLRWLFRWLYRSRLGNRFFPFRSLTAFKSKFAPRWEPVYIGGWPSIGPWSLYVGCRMWGLFGPPRLRSSAETSSVTQAPPIERLPHHDPGPAES